MFSFFSAIATIAYRDVLKLFRDIPRLIFSFIFPILFVGVLGTSMQASFGAASGQDLLTFTFLGVLAQTLFQSTAAGIISLIEDRENDYSQEIFVSPTNRYAILLGKIVGESAVSFVQVVGVVAFGLLIGVNISLVQLLVLIPVGILICLLGGSFGILVLANLNNQRTANQIFPFLIFPQLFLGGVFAPVGMLPLPLYLLSRIAPLTYAVDLVRGVYFATEGVQSSLVLLNPWTNLLVVIGMFLVFLVIGTYVFVRNEKNR
ncbi:MAG: ABC transporter permease [Candidatus Dojkabacteria bacterium]|nr:MAG: ABC transporter permease [Candidatus Dojkabacteria bacterium]